MTGRAAAARRLGVIGWPVAHSRSPAIQNAALAAAGLSGGWRYQLLPIPPELFRETVLALPAAGFRGVNVTIPHKAAAYELATGATDRAAAIGAANALVFEQDGRIQADNTDAPALIAALSERIELAGSSAVILGAGGTGRTAGWALRDAGARSIHIWNRTPARAAELAAALGGLVVSDVRELPAADVLINTTSVGLNEDDRLEALGLSTEQLDRHRVVVDYTYRPGGTALATAARGAGVPTIDGLELLVGQGELAFELFTGKDAPVEAMRAAVGISSPR